MRLRLGLSPLLAENSFYIPPQEERLGLDIDENYNVYGDFNYSGSIVLDAGADFGSTSKFFILKGAKKIIAVEQADIHFKNLCENAKRNNKIIPLHLGIHLPEFWNKQHSLSTTWEKLIVCFEPNYIKSDIESGEKHLVDVPDEVLKIVRGFTIECHGDDIRLALQEKFTKNGFKIIGEHRDYSGIYKIVSFYRPI